MPLKGFGISGLFGLIGGSSIMAVLELAKELESRRRREEEERERERERQRQRQRFAASQTMTEEEEESDEEREYPVVVVGCGASGIAALTKLKERGIEAIGLEASDRIGGRIHTVDFGAGVVDLGAAWCHGEVGNLVHQLASPHGLLGRPPWLDVVEDELFIVSNGGLMPKGNSDAIRHAIETAVERNDKSSNRSITEFVRTGVRDGHINTEPVPLPISESFLEWYDRDNHLNGQNTPQTAKSLKGLVVHEQCPGEQWLHWKGRGYKQILDVLMGKVHNSSGVELNIQYRSEVTNICWIPANPDPKDPVPTVWVTCNGSVIKASKVIVTVPLGVLKERYLTMFSPPLPPNKVVAINSLQVCTLNKIYIQFLRPWWPEGLTNFRIIWREEEKRNFVGSENWITGIYGLRTVEHQPNVLLAWLYGTHAVEMEAVSDEAVRNGVNKLLGIFRRNYHVTPISAIKRSKWASNHLARGSYSYRAVSTEVVNTSAEVLAEPLTVAGKTVVCFAGEATSTKWHGAVHGAIDAGFREANRLSP